MNGMTNRETLRSLADTVEALSGPNREIGQRLREYVLSPSLESPQP